MQVLIILIGFIGLIAGLIIYNAMSWGYVLFKLWTWYVLPVFTTLPHLTYWQAVGLFFVIGLFDRVSNSSRNNKKEDGETSWSPLTAALISPWAVLFIAWCFFKFM